MLPGVIFLSTLVFRQILKRIDSVQSALSSRATLKPPANRNKNSGVLLANRVQGRDLPQALLKKNNASG